MHAHWFIFAVSAFCLATPAAAEGGENSLILLTEHNPPAAYLDEATGQISGQAVEVVEGLMKSAGISYSLLMLPWNRAYRRARSEQNVCVFPANKTPEREAQFEWISPILLGGWAIFKRPDSVITIAEFADLRRYSLVGKMDSTATDILEKELGQPVARAVDDVAAAKLLYGGRVDMWLSGRTSVVQASKEAGVPQPALAFNWKAAELGVACHVGTDKEVLELLRSTNHKRLDVTQTAASP